MQNTKFVLLTTMAIAATLAAQVAASAAGDDVKRGARLAGQFCATCHMNKDQGEKHGPTGIPGFKAVANRPGQNEAQIVDWLISKPPMMPTITFRAARPRSWQPLSCRFAPNSQQHPRLPLLASSH